MYDVAFYLVLWGVVGGLYFWHAISNYYNVTNLAAVLIVFFSGPLVWVWIACILAFEWVGEMKSRYSKT